MLDLEIEDIDFCYAGMEKEIDNDESMFTSGNEIFSEFIEYSINKYSQYIFKNYPEFALEKLKEYIRSRNFPNIHGLTHDIIFTFKPAFSDQSPILSMKFKKPKTINLNECDQ